MGEVSKNVVMVLAITVIVVSAVGTWAVMNAAMNMFGGTPVPLTRVIQQTEDNVKGIVDVFVNGTIIPVSSTSSQTLAGGVVAVYINSTS